MHKFLIALLAATPLFGCGDILLHSEDGAYINARSMEFSAPLKSTLIAHPRGERRQSEAPNGQNGLSWTSKYGYVAVGTLGVGLTADGLNEKGLSFGALWLPTTQYQTVAANQTGNAIALEVFGDWVLGNFTTVDEVRDALAHVYVWGRTVPEMRMIPPLHFALHDATGSSLVVEYVDGQLKTYDNPLGVLTNYPTFQWHIDNLRNYAKLNSPDNAQQIDFGKIEIPFYGQGSGLLGIPGDWMPASRFVRLALFKKYAQAGDTATATVNTAEHIFNTVDIPIGAIREDNDKPSDYTQWVIFKDLTNKKLYYRTYGNLALRSVDLTKLNFDAGSTHKPLTMESKQEPIDVTNGI